jgi:hypothetical protein
MSDNGIPNGRITKEGGVDNAPPQDLDAERALLCALMLDNSKIPEVMEILEANDFYRDAHEWVYRSIVRLYEEGKGIDAVTVAFELKQAKVFAQVGGIELLAEITAAAPHGANAVFHAQIVKQCSIARSTIQISAEAIRDGYSGLFTPAQNLERAINRLGALTEDLETAWDDDIRDFPAQPGEAAFHGIMGRIVREIDPYTEANLAAILLQLLVGFGNMVGRGPYWVHEADKHRLNLYLCLVGNTADGKKGTSWGYPRRILSLVDPTWSERIIPGINSGPALIEQVADEETTRTGSFLRGVGDKRVLLYESEFTRLLAIFARDSETLGMVLRQAWEDENLAALSKKNPVRATGAHVSVVAHVTPEDLQANLSLTDIANGLGNRFLWVCTKASKKLDSEARLDWRRLNPHIEQLKLALEFGQRDIGLDNIPMGRTPTAQKFWKEQLTALQKRRPGLLGAILARGPAQVMRLATTYAVLDQQKYIDVIHLEAALELWGYCVRSIDFIFGDRLGDKDADKLLKALEDAGESGLSQSDIQRKVFSNHKDASELRVLLRRMIRSGLIRRELAESNKRGPRACMWFLDTPGGGISANSLQSFQENEPPPF